MKRTNLVLWIRLFTLFLALLAPTMVLAQEPFSLPPIQLPPPPGGGGGTVTCPAGQVPDGKGGCKVKSDGSGGGGGGGGGNKVECWNGTKVKKAEDCPAQPKPEPTGNCIPITDPESQEERCAESKEDFMLLFEEPIEKRAKELAANKIVAAWTTAIVLIIAFFVFGVIMVLMLRGKLVDALVYVREAIHWQVNAFPIAAGNVAKQVAGQSPDPLPPPPSLPSWAPSLIEARLAAAAKKGGVLPP